MLPLVVLKPPGNTMVQVDAGFVIRIPPGPMVKR